MIFKTIPSKYLVTFTLFLASSASAFEWRLNDVWVCGDAPFTTCDDFPVLDSFIDDFEDGDRTVEPSSALIDYSGSNVSESGGYLSFNSDNGGIEIDLGDGSTPYTRDEVYLNISVPDNTGDGLTSVSAQFDSDLSQLAVGGVSDTSSGFGITFAGILNSTDQN
ncbi:MAG: hypothetical protein P8I62_03960, partial [Pseudomonadales bacterium]|nr:hypothetical protein [Pseudomonadales bacterium]